MTIRLLGTGGADGIPALFGDDPISQWARQHGGADLRTRASALVDDGLKIDLPPETGAQLLKHGLSAKEWDLLLFTHSDDDHLAVSELQYALHPFTENFALPFPIFGNEVVLETIRARFDAWPMDLNELTPFATFESTGYLITPLLARHTPGERCYNYLIEREGRRLIYATDTGVWSEETIDAVSGIEVHLMVVECTNAMRPSTYQGHLDLDGLGYLLGRLRTNKTLLSSSRVVTTHHAAIGGARHCDLESVLAPLDAKPGFDGMLLEV